MARTAGATARRLDFGESGVASTARRGPGRSRLTLAASGVPGPDKYRELDLRRRRAQIRARRLLDLIEGA
jgi:hypothetical protein